MARRIWSLNLLRQPLAAPADALQPMPTAYVLDDPAAQSSRAACSSFPGESDPGPGGRRASRRDTSAGTATAERGSRKALRVAAARETQTGAAEETQLADLIDGAIIVGGATLRQPSRRGQN